LKQISPSGTVCSTARRVRLRASPTPTIWRHRRRPARCPTASKTGHQIFREDSRSVMTNGSVPTIRAEPRGLDICAGYRHRLTERAHLATPWDVAQRRTAGPVAARPESAAARLTSDALTPALHEWSRRVGAWIDESAPLPGETGIAEVTVHRVEEHFRSAGYNDQTEDHRNRRR
jgi:hypothetical protein